jgi:hypothetical protein
MPTDGQQVSADQGWCPKSASGHEPAEPVAVPPAPPEIPADLKAALTYLRRLEDNSGYDGYSQNSYHVKIASLLEDYWRNWTTEQAMHAAWRKRAEEAERALEGKRA